MDIAICVVTYNRLHSLSRLLDSLEKAEYPDGKVTLMLSVDKSDSDATEKFCDAYFWPHGEKRVVHHEKNLGLRRHILKCGDLLTEFEALVVLEDDIVVAPSFYLYAMQCVESYYGDERIAGVSLYSFAVNYHNQLPFYPQPADSDVYLMKCAQSWGQVWMRPQWQAFKDWYYTHNEEFSALAHLPRSICYWPKSSWLKYHTRYCIEEGKYFVYPYTSLTTNYMDAGVHSTTAAILFQTVLQSREKRDFKLNPIVSYDGFFENESLCAALGFDESSLCVDLYGEKENRLQCRYHLTPKHLDYHIIKTFGFVVRPMEANIFNEVEGEDIFLYDTSIPEINPNPSGEYKRNRFLYNLNSGATWRINPPVPLKTQVLRKLRDKLTHLMRF